MRRNMNFRTRLIILLFAIGLIPLCAMTAIVLWSAGSSFSKETFSHLESMREIKKAFLTDYFDTLQSQVTMLRDDPYIGRALIAFNRVAEKAGGKTMNPQWEQVADVYDPHFKDILRNNKWYDIFLINPDGRIIYTVIREPDLGMVIPTSDLKHSSIGYAFKQAQAQGSALSDFAPYAPSAGAPAGFAMARVQQNGSGQTIGYVAFQIPLDKITKIMQERAGMGKSGETYLVGSDLLMRSDSYLAPHVHSVVASFADPANGMVDTTATREALAGKTDTRIITDYRGEHVLSAFTPIQMGETIWALIAEIDAAEAFSAIVTLKWISAIAVLLIVTAIFPTAFMIVKPLSRATAELKSAAEELRVASQQQTTSSTEQATATNQIFMTMEELLRTAQQIAEATANAAAGTESAHQVSKEGMHSLQKAIEGISEMGAKTDNITQNILSLGEKAQQMSLVLEIINELADQTTILSFNAGIEAAGAGEAGIRFGAVAEQIMNLANKASGSTKEIRLLIEDVQKSATKTILIAEEGMKTAGESQKRIQDMATHFETILNVSEENMVTAKQVDMTVTQQTASIYQATDAIKNIQLTADDVRSSTKQTLETAQMLFKMSDGLARI